MKVVATFIATRVMEIGEPEGEQSKEEFLQLQKEAVIQDPFSFIDTTDIEVMSHVVEVE